MRQVFTFLIIFGCFSFSSCNWTAKKQKSEAISRASHAIHEGFQKSRYDIAFRYSVELVRLVPPPDKRIEIKAIKAPKTKSPADSKNIKEVKTNSSKNIIIDITGKIFSSPDTSLGENLVILPEIAANKTVVVENSAEFNTLLEENKELKKQIIKERKEKEKFEKQVDTVIKKEAETIRRADERDIINKHSFWGKVKFWGIVVACAGGLGALMWFFPVIIPVVSIVARGIGRGIGAFFRIITELFTKK